MNQRRKVLLVSPTTRIATPALDWLAQRGFDVTVVASFVAAKAALDEDPDLVIAEVRLGSYNGLHLALRADARHIPCIVIGDDDPLTAGEARNLGALYLSSFDRATLEAAVEQLAHGSVHPGGWGPYPAERDLLRHAG